MFGPSSPLEKFTWQPSFFHHGKQEEDNAPLLFILVLNPIMLVLNVWPNFTSIRRYTLNPSSGGEGRGTLWD
jgi:hypothetical protein